MHNRREFILKTTGLVISTAVIPSCINFKKDYLLISASNSDKHSRDRRIRRSDPYLCVYDSRTNEAEVFKVPTLIHSIVQHPYDKFKFLCLPKFDDVAFLYDHKTKQTTQFNCDDGFLFYGHGSFSEDGMSIYTAQSIKTPNVHVGKARTNYKGVVKIWGLNDFTLKGELESFGNDPHDMKPLGKDHAVVANGGKNTNISIVDLNSKSLIKQYHCEFEGLSCRHLIVDNKDIYVLSAVKNSHDRCSLFYPQDGKLVPFGFPKEKEKYFTAALLSGAVNQKYIVTTSPKNNVIHVWDRISRTLIDIKEYEQAAGVALSTNDKKFIVTSAFENNGLELKIDNKILSKTNDKYRKLTGSHTLMATI